MTPLPRRGCGGGGAPGASLLLVTSIALAAGGCMTTRDGELLRRDLRQVQSEVAEVQLRGHELKKATAEAKEQIAKLREVLVQATNLVQRNSADLGVQVQRIQRDLDVLSGKTAEIYHGLDSVTKQFTEYRAQTDVKLESLVSRTPAGRTLPAPEDKEALFTAANQRYQAGQFEEARRLFRTFLNRFSRDDRADNAQFWLGQSYYEERKYAAAIAEYKKVIDTFQRGDAVDRAMYGMALSFIELKYCTEGGAYLRDLIKRFPRSSLVKKARQRLRQLRRIRRNKRFCMT